MISEILSKTYTEQEKVLIDRKISYDRGKYEFAFWDTYGYLFDGYTSINNLMDVKVVSYNVTALKIWIRPYLICSYSISCASHGMNLLQMEVL